MHSSIAVNVAATRRCLAALRQADKVYEIVIAGRPGIESLGQGGMMAGLR